MASAVLARTGRVRGVGPEGAGWRVEPSAIPDLQSLPMDASLRLPRRLDLLPGPTGDLLSAGAILGKEFDLDLAAELAQQSPAQAVAALDEGRRRDLVWVRAGGRSLPFVHDRFVRRS